MELQQPELTAATPGEEPSGGELGALQVGDLVCIERRGYPWRVARVRAIEEDTITTEAGTAYDLSTGMRLESKGSAQDVLQVLTGERLDSLLVLAFLQELAQLNPRHLSPHDHEVLVHLARRFMSQREPRGRDRFLKQVLLAEEGA